MIVLHQNTYSDSAEGIIEDSSKAYFLGFTSKKLVLPQTETLQSSLQCGLRLGNQPEFHVWFCSGYANKTCADTFEYHNALQGKKTRWRTNSRFVSFF